MGSDVAPSEPAKRPMSRRQKRKLVISVLVIAIAAVVVFWGWNSTGKSYPGIASLVSESQSSVPSKYFNKTIELQGIVADWSGSVNDTDFKLVDKADATKSIDVNMMGIYPADFDNGKTIVAKGELASSLPLRLSASAITIGCSSKY